MKYFNPFYYFIIFSVSSFVIKSIDIETQQKIITSLIIRLNIKHYILVKESGFEIDSKILKFAKNSSKNYIYGSFFTVNHLHEYLKIYEKNFSLRPVEFLTPKTIIFQRQNQNISGIIPTVFKDSYKLVVPNYIWLNFIDQNTSISEVFKESYVPYNSEVLVVKSNLDIVEIYHTETNMPLFENYYGTWMGKLIISDSDFYQRRIDMRNTELTFSVMTNEEALANWETSIHSEIINHFSQVMNYSPVIFNNNYREYYQLIMHLNGSSLAEFSVHSMGFGIVGSFYSLQADYMGPFLIKRAYFYLAFNENYEKFDALTYLKPFSSYLWMVIVLWILLTGTCFAIISFFDKGKNRLNISVLFFQPFKILTNQSGGKESRNKQTRIISLTSRLIPLFLIPAYSGVILSFILSNKVKFPFKDIEELNIDKTYSLGFFLNGGYLLKDFEKHTTQYLFTRWVTDHSSVREAIQAMCQNHTHSVLSFEDPRLQEHKICKIIRSKKPAFESWDVVQARRKSPYLKIFNRLLKTAHSSGIIKRYEKRVIRYDLDIKDKTTLIPVGFKNIKPILMILGILYGFSILIFIVESGFIMVKNHIRA